MPAFSRPILSQSSRPVGLIEGDAGDHRDVGINDVGGVETPAEPDLKDHYIQLRLLKQPQRRERAVFKIGQRDVTRAASISANEAVCAASGSSAP